MADSRYQRSFLAFCQHTDEKEVLRHEVLAEMARRGIRSLLDIGAGDGSLAVPFSQAVDCYCAVEGHGGHARLLREAGLNVVEGSFPQTPVSGRYDGVLLCHVISYRTDAWTPMLIAAWERVVPGGSLLLVTYRGREDAWTRFTRHLHEELAPRYADAHRGIRELLESFGGVEERELVSHVRAADAETMMRALAFVAANGDPEREQRFFGQRERIIPYLREHHAEGRGFAFPFSQYLIGTRKEG